MAHYFRGLMKIIFANMNPATAIREREPGQADASVILGAIASLIAVEVENSNDEVPA
jgi:hypothetical protein